MRRRTDRLHPICPGDILVAWQRCTRSRTSLDPIVLFEEGETCAVLSVAFQDFEGTEDYRADFVVLSQRGPIHWKKEWRNYTDFLTNMSAPC